MSSVNDQVSERELEAALQSVAQLVNSYGDKYWPIFERLENELDDMRSRSKRLTDALGRSFKCSPDLFNGGKGDVR